MDMSVFPMRNYNKYGLMRRTHQKKNKAKGSTGNDGDDILKKKISGAKDALRQLDVHLFNDTASGNIYNQREGKTSRLCDDHVLQLRVEIAGKFKFGSHGKNLSEAEFSKRNDA